MMDAVFASSHQPAATNHRKQNVAPAENPLFTFLPKELGDVLTDLHKKPGQLRDMLGGDAAQQASGANPIV